MHILLTLLLAACGGGEDTTKSAKSGGVPSADAKAKAKAGADKAAKAKRPEPKGEPIQVAGTLDFQEDGGAVLKPCDGGDALTLKPGSGNPERVREELGAEVDEVYVEMRGMKQDDGSVVVRAFDVAMVGGGGCDAPLEATLVAFGNEPGWRVALDAEGAKITRQDGGDLTFSEVSRSVEKGPPTFELSGSGQDGKITVKRERCKDTMASAFYPWKATFVLGDATLEGCARGDLPKLKKPDGADPAEE